MKSPFPGMDPYLEARWSDVHATMVTAIKEALQPQLPRDLRARSEERVLLEATDGEPEGSYRSDVAVVSSQVPARERPAPAGLPTIEPVVIAFHDQPIVERWVQILDTTSGQRVVTAIEVLSPWNKAPGRLNATYRRTLVDYGRGAVSVVEIDLLRHPSRGRLEVRSENLPQARRAPYLVCVRKAWQPSQWLAYPLPLRERLPALSVPLRQTDPEAILDLQVLIDRVYRAATTTSTTPGRPIHRWAQRTRNGRRRSSPGVHPVGSRRSGQRSRARPRTCAFPKLPSGHPGGLGSPPTTPGIHLPLRPGAAPARDAGLGITRAARRTRLQARAGRRRDLARRRLRGAAAPAAHGAAASLTTTR